MAQTKQGKKIVHVRGYSFVNFKGIKVTVGTYRRSTPN